MVLKSPASIDDHGFRPLSYVVQSTHDSDPSEFGSGVFQDRYAKVQRITLSYGQEDATAQIEMYDNDSIQAVTPDVVDEILTQLPSIGDRIKIFSIDKNNFTKTKFKGAIRAIHERRTENGIIYGCDCVSESSRLNDSFFYGTFNKKNQDVNVSPRFDSNGYLVEPKRLNIQEIVQEILRFKDAWESDEYFSYSNINWNGLQDRVGTFIPSELRFSGSTSKGRAIFETLQRAGNYTYFYNPDNDDIVIIELDRTCSHCGDEWTVTFPPDPNPASTPYATDYNVIGDDTDWNSNETVNVVRVVTGQVEWYSGHTGIVDNIGHQGVLNYFYTQQVAFEGYRYRFHDPTDVFEDHRNVRLHYIGASLFPDWNVHADFLPVTKEIRSFSLPKDNEGNSDPDFPLDYDNYSGHIELEPFSYGDEAAQGSPRTGNLNHLMEYQLWYSTEACPACNGGGAVNTVYYGNNNNPSLQFYQDRNGKWSYRVTNYLFDPINFGKIDNDTGELVPPTGLSAFTYEGGEYPLPHKNLCPYCRGTGRKPEYKIRNVKNDLVQGRGFNLDTFDGSVTNSVPLDVDTWTTGPETWEQSQNRLTISLFAQVQVEDIFSLERLPDFGNRNKHASDEDFLTYYFTHPNNFGLDQRMHTLWGSQADKDGNEPQPKVIPIAPNDPYDWTASTSVGIAGIVCGTDLQYTIDHQLGKVLFHKPNYIPCEKYTARILDPIVVSYTKLLMRSDTWGGPTVTGTDGNITGFWRPARAWLTCFYTRDDYYETPLRDPITNDDVGERTITADDPAGNPQIYEAKAMIADGRYVVEVIKKNPSEDEDAPEFSTGNRRIMRVIEDDQLEVQVFPKDFYDYPIPTKADMKDDEYTEEKKNQSWTHSKGYVLKWITASSGETQAELEGYTDQDYKNNPVRPRVFDFRFRDDRSIALGMAIRALESNNDILVEGHVTVKAYDQDLETGLGYIDYPNRTLAAVTRAVYNLGEDFTIDLELTVPEQRFGESPRSEVDRVGNIEKIITRLSRTVELQQSTMTNGRRTRAKKHDADDQAAQAGPVRRGKKR